jgi:hypothetical protein
MRPHDHDHGLVLVRARARARAHARSKSDGAAMFIVAVTLGLLAAMGVYGLSATAYDVRAAGHTREAMQAQHAAEEGIILAAETLQPGTAGEIVRAMQAEANAVVRQRDTTGTTTVVCKTAKPLSSASLSQQAEYRAAEACYILTPKEMEAISLIKTPVWNPPFRTKVGAAPGAFGDVELYPFIRVELTNPIDWAMPAGYTTSSSSVQPPIYTQVRATVYVELKPGTSFADARDNNAAQVVATGRGRLIVGPYTP